jgi:hypothetical protein
MSALQTFVESCIGIYNSSAPGHDWGYFVRAILLLLVFYFTLSMLQNCIIKLSGGVNRK